MKPLVIIVLSVAGAMALAVVALIGARVNVNPVEPITAAFIGAASAALGILPLLRTGRRDLVSILQMAMVGTVLHLLAQVALVGGMLFTHTLAARGPSLGWLLAQYWISLIALIWQLRRMILDIAPAAKAGQ